MEETKYTYEDLFKALNSLEDDKKNTLLEGFKASDLLDVMNSEKNMKIR